MYNHVRKPLILILLRLRRERSGVDYRILNLVKSARTYRMQLNSREQMLVRASIHVLNLIVSARHTCR